MTGFSAGKPFRRPTYLREPVNFDASKEGQGSPMAASHNAGGKYGGFSTFLGKMPQNFNYYGSDYYLEGEMPALNSRGFAQAELRDY